jgi:cbb3-type cytochrome oxidase maturation protein
MSSLYLLIPLGLVILVISVWAFFWAVRKGQFEDLDSPGMRILLDDDAAPAQLPGARTSERSDA